MAASIFLQTFPFYMSLAEMRNYLPSAWRLENDEQSKLAYLNHKTK